MAMFDFQAGVRGTFDRIVAALVDERDPHPTRPEIVAGLNGVPVYGSRYLLARKKKATALLQRLALGQQRDRLSFDDVWNARPRFPIAACFNVHTVCNEACVMCPYEAIYETKSHSIMPLNVYSELLKDFVECGGRIVTFNNFSDIFAHKNGIDYVEHTLKHFGDQVQLYLVTNGMGMRADYVDRLLGLGLDGIVYCSCHGFSEETFRRVTKRKGFKKVKNNITYLAQRHPHPDRIIIQYADDFSPEAELLAAYTYWSELGCAVNSFETHTFGGNSNHKEQDTFQGRLAGCKGWGDDAGQPFYQIVIQHNGDVSLCCHDLTADVILGNAITDGVAGAWNSEAFKTLVRDLYLGESDDKDFICRKCGLVQTVQDA